MEDIQTNGVRAAGQNQKTRLKTRYEYLNSVELALIAVSKHGRSLNRFIVVGKLVKQEMER